MEEKRAVVLHETLPEDSVRLAGLSREAARRAGHRCLSWRRTTNQKKNQKVVDVMNHAQDLPAIVEREQEEKKPLPHAALCSSSWSQQRALQERHAVDACLAFVG